jgi:2-amino-4-hydroxy-6-hydroxymethyldihydropteridine diphosphokinase
MPFGGLKGSNHAQQRIFIALGANKAYRSAGPLENLQSALKALESAGVTIIKASRPWRSPAWPDPSDPPYVNACAQVACMLGPGELMALLHGIEKRHGRQRSVKNAPRSLDLDLIDFQGAIRHPDQTAGLQLPHPRATGRAFVLLPLRDIAPDWRDPVSRQTLDQLIARLPVEDRKACRPAGGMLCAAASGLKPASR